MWFRDSEAKARALSIQAYRTWLRQPQQANLVARARTELCGRNLACWCPPGSPCHADVLLELANGSEEDMT
ncbi:MAG: protein of unknown function containing DUF4326 domain [Rhodobacteraceae bacterium HLUCCA12]|nr:MAG: protein of unknown function containing DUF4326 domain [Rhodobacteraceae bacterium HLUCCA12]